MIKTALVGYGFAGKVFHAPFISHVPELALTHIMSSREAEFKAAYPDVKALKSIEEVVESEAELVVIATPNDTHYEFAKEVLEAGKHVVIDKPMTPTAKQARELSALAKEKKLVLSVFHNRRLDGDFLTVKKVIEENKIGNPVYFESNFHRFRPQVNLDNWRETTKTAGGIFFDLAPHLLDQAISLFGVPDKAMADIGWQREGAINDDYFHLVLIFGKLRAHLSASTVYKAPNARFIVNGDQGSFVKYGMDPQEVRVMNSGYSENVGVDAEENYGRLYGETEEITPTVSGNYLGYYQNIAKAVSDGEELLVSSAQASFVMEMLEALMKSHLEQRFVEKGKDYDLA